MESVTRASASTARVSRVVHSSPVEAPPRSGFGHRAPMPWPLPPHVEELMVSQHGVATARQLDGLGLSPRRLRSASRAELLVRLHRGAYALGTAWAGASPEVRHCMRLLAVQLAAVDAIAWGATATIAWGLPVRRVPDLPTVRRAPERGSTAGAVVTRPACAVSAPTRHAGLLVPSVAEAVVEVASSSCLSDALITVDAALRRGVPGRDLLALAQRRPAHLGRVRALQAIEWGDPGSESWLESLSRGRMVERRMPVPLCNVVLRRGQRTARVDNLWPELGVVGESDGKGKYRRKGGQGDSRGESSQQNGVNEVIWREKRRHEWIEEIGFEVARWGTAEVAEDGAAMETRFRRSVVLQQGAGFAWPDGVRAEMPLLKGVAPPVRVVSEVVRLQSLGYPFMFVDHWHFPVDPPALGA